jgi:ABC-2 type transport system permease protein
MLRNVFTKTLWDQRRSLLAWAIGITAVGLGYAAFYPAMRSPEFEEAMAAFPPEIMDAMGFADITTPAGYVGSTTFGLLGPALILVFAAALGGSAIAGDEEPGRLDLILAHPVSRWSVLVQRFTAMVVSMLVVCAILAVGLIAISGPAELTDIGVANIVSASIHLALLGIVFGALAIGISAATGRRSLVYGAVATVGVVAFLGNNLAPAIDALAWLRDISPFHYYSGGLPLRNGFQPADAAILAAASGVLVALGGLVFDRRDIAV